MLEEDRTNPGKESLPPTARELATVLFRQWKLFVGVSGLIFLLSVIYAVAGTTYRAHLRVLVRRGRSDPPVTAQPISPPDFSRVEVSEEELNSEVELLKDDDVLRRVVEANGLASDDWLRWVRPHEEQAAGIERATKRLANRLKVESIKKTNLIAVSYDATNPRRAAHVLQSLSSIYLEKHMEVHRPAGQFLFFEQQTAQSRQQLEDAKRKLLTFAKSHGVVVAAQQRDLLLRRLDAAEESYGQTQLQMSQTEHRVRELDSQIADLPQRATTQLRTADNPELLRALKATLLDLQLKKIQLLTKFEPNHRLVQEAEQQILQAKLAIAAETLTPVRDESGRVVQLPHLERMFAEASAAIRQFQMKRPPQKRLHWNRILLYVWPVLDVSPDDLQAIAYRLAPETDGPLTRPTREESDPPAYDSHSSE